MERGERGERGGGKGGGGGGGGGMLDRIRSRHTPFKEPGFYFTARKLQMTGVEFLKKCI